MNDNPVRVGVVGLGSFGRHHARHYAANPGAQLVAIADLDVSRARSATAANGGEPHASYRDLLGKVDAVSIATPASLHYAIARDFIEAGVHVLIEKPIATESDHARELVASAVARGVILQVGHVERFSPAITELRSRISDPRRIACVRQTVWTGRSEDVDVVLDLMIHDIDLVLSLAGSPVASVAANGADVRSGMTDEAEAWLTFESGLIATLSASRVAPANLRRITVTEPDVAFVADLGKPSLTMQTRRRPGAAPVDVLLPARDNLGAEIDAFLKSVRTGAPPEVDGRAGLAALQVAERIQTAINENTRTAKKARDV